MYTIAKVKIAVSKHVFAMVQKPTPVCQVDTQQWLLN